MYYSALELLALLIVTVAIMVQTWAGIGFALLAAPLLYLINPAYVPGPILILGFGLSLLVVLQQYHQLNWRRILPAVIARLPGAWLGAYLLLILPQYLLSILFSSTLLIAILITWRSFKIPISAVSLSIGGFFSGLIGTATSVGGPPIALVLQESDRVSARNELATFFLLGTPLSIAMLGLYGNINQQSLLLCLKMTPGLLLGFWLANRLDGKIKTTSAKPLLLTLSAATALVVLYQGLLGWFTASSL